MNTAYGSVFLASLIGSVHCAAMCGGFVSFCGSLGKRPSLSLCCYHLGRLIAYMALGCAAGILGKSINNTETLTGIQQLTSLITGILLILWGVSNFFELPLAKISTANAITKESLFARVFAWIHSPGRPLLKTGILGLCSGLLPCGWLFTYVALAATTAHPLGGAALMGVFWLGTVPILTVVGGLASVAMRSLGPHLPKIVGTLLIAAGLFSLYSHVNHTHEGHGHHSHGNHS